MRAVLTSLLLFLVPVAVAQSPFLSVPAAGSDELRFGAHLAEFEAKDITGRSWRVGDLRGKFTVIYVWHTFEGRAADKLNSHGHETVGGLPDLPELQRFYETVRESRDVQVLTFCRDYDYTHAREYMKERGYTFPVVADWVVTNKLFDRAEGTYRVVNREGELSGPFHSWSFRRVLFEVEKAAGNQ